MQNLQKINREIRLPDIRNPTIEVRWYFVVEIISIEIDPVEVSRIIRLPDIILYPYETFQTGPILIRLLEASA